MKKKTALTIIEGSLSRKTKMRTWAPNLEGASSLKDQVKNLQSNKLEQAERSKL